MTVSVQDILSFLGSQQHMPNIKVEGVSSLQNSRPGTLSFIQKDFEGWQRFTEQRKDVLFLIHKDFGHPTDNCLISENPRLDFSRITTHFFADARRVGVEPSAEVAEDFKLQEGVYIGHHCVIESGVYIGKGTQIDHNTVIKKNVVIGNECFVGANCSLGGVGFGFELDETGFPIRVPHVGGVKIGDRVEIGNNVSIARGTIDNTHISDDVKIDDNVFIAHNVSIGERSFIIAGTEISGSVSVGKNVWISPQVCVINKISIGDDTLIGIGATVTKDLPENSVAVGSPAKVIRSRFKR